MLQCGCTHQPTKVLFEIAHFKSSTSPIKVNTDIGEGYVKGINNPLGNRPLICELVAAELASWFGLKVPPFAIITECEIELTMKKNQQLMLPPMFFSYSVDGDTRDGSDTFLKKLNDKDDVAKLVVFDTWIRNNDRYALGVPNSDNLIYSLTETGRMYDLIPIDHSEAFVDLDFSPNPPAENEIMDINVYGRFPEFDAYINHRSVSNAIQKLSTLDRVFVERVVNSVPAEWGLGDFASASLVELICARAEYVVDSLPARLVDDPELPGING